MDNKRIIALGLSTILSMSILSGCSGSVTKGGAASVQLQSELTQQEVLDYYAKALSYDTVVTRNVDEHKTNFEVKDVTNKAKQDLLTKAVGKTLSLLSTSKYSAYGDDTRFLSEGLYHYMKAMLNDKKLTGQKTIKMTQALGYYFVDVEFDISSAPIGTFKDSVSLLGLNGAFTQSSLDGTFSVDESFVNLAVDKLNKYYKENGIAAQASYSKSTMDLNINGNGGQGFDFSSTTSGEVIEPPIENPTTRDVNGNDQPDNTETPTSTEGSDTVNDPNTGGLNVSDPNEVETPVVNEPVTNTQTNKTDSKVVPAREHPLNLREVNSIVGYGGFSSIIPDLDMIYNIPAANGGINGIGLYPSGKLGLAIAASDSNNLSGRCVIRFVYKEDILDSDILTCENIYTIHQEIYSGAGLQNNDTMIPDFLNNEFSTLIERADRAIVNDDTTGLVGGAVFQDIGMGVLVGYQARYTNVMRQISSLRRILARNLETNTYVVEIDSYRTEGAKVAGQCTSYNDTIYAVIQQIGSEFVITDWEIMNRDIAVEPDINPDAATAKRIVALGLTGNISEETKESVNRLLNDLYTASSNRRLRGPYKVGDTTYEKGMYDCFNSNVNMLSSTRKEQINADLRSVLVKYGTATTATMVGQVTQWYGGSNNENQVEFFTEELVTYNSENIGTYSKCYYLASCIEDVWVIDDLQVIERRDVSGDELISIRERIQ